MSIYVRHQASFGHETGGHPESGDRLLAIEEELCGRDWLGLELVEAPRASDEQLERVHTRGHVRSVEALCRKGRGKLDADTLVSEGSWEAALRSAGAAVTAVERLDAGAAGFAFCGLRPPGHHAERARGMGFCLFNNIAISAKYARDAHDAERVAVVDFDVHHGNGTQDAFWSDKDFFFASTHQMPLFPGTGAVGETGVGNIFNAPLRSGDDGDKFKEAMSERILGPLQEFGPDIILISAGFDAHKNDPLASLGLVEEDFAWATREIMDIAEASSNGRVVSTLEGGYDLGALASSAAAHVRALMSG